MLRAWRHCTLCSSRCCWLLSPPLLAMSGRVNSQTFPASSDFKTSTPPPRSSKPIIKMRQPHPWYQMFGIAPETPFKGTLLMHIYIYICIYTLLIIVRPFSFTLTFFIHYMPKSTRNSPKITQKVLESRTSPRRTRRHFITPRDHAAVIQESGERRGSCLDVLDVPKFRRFGLDIPVSGFGGMKLPTSF